MGGTVTGRGRERARLSRQSFSSAMSTANVRQDKDSGPIKTSFFSLSPPPPLATNGLEMIHQLIEYLLARSPTNADPTFTRDDGTEGRAVSGPDKIMAPMNKINGPDRDPRCRWVGCQSDSKQCRTL